MRTFANKIVAALLLLVLCAVSTPFAVYAEVPYATFTKDSYGRPIYMQPAYAPSGVLGRDIFIQDKNGKRVYSPLKKPQDLFIDKNDELYVADTENNRIVHFNQDGGLIRILSVPDKPLKLPQGIFVADNGDIYIADTGNKRIVKLDKKGEFVKEFGRPDSKFLDKDFVFEPKNMAIDERGFIYVVSNGSFQGLVLLDPEGSFYGFHGTNVSEAKLMDKLRSLFYTKEQLNRQIRLLPATIRSIDIDREGYIYTTSGSSIEQIKKLNIRGDNLWKDMKFGEKWLGKPPALMDITVDRNGNLSAIDKANSAVIQYDPNGKVLFFWFGEGNAGIPKVGLMKSPSAIDSNSKNELFILDDSLNFIQVFKPTELGSAVHEAYLLSQEGKYEESEKLWKNVVKLNAMFAPAYEGLAQAAYFNGNYEAAKDLYKLAGSRWGYSDTFWQIRLQWFQQYFSIIANGMLTALIVFALAAKVAKSVRARRPIREVVPASGTSYTLPKQLRHAFYIMKHPIDGFSDLRYLNMGSFASALILLGLVALVLLIKTYFTSFTFYPVPMAYRESGSMLAIFGLVWISWVVCNFLIGNIFKGEAHFKDIFMGGAYALFPILLLGLPLALLSNVMTLSEASIYAFFDSLIVIWCALLFFWKIQSLQNYGVGGTIANILLTAFMVVVLWTVILIVFGMFTEFLNFLYSIYQEVTM